MKKQLILIAVFIFAVSISKAQSASGGSFLNLGVGFGTPFFGTGYSSSLPVNPVVSFEKSVADEFSAGAEAAYASSNYNFSGYGLSYTFKETAIYVGARGSYHFNKALGLGDKADLYAGASAGYVVVSVSDNLGNAASAASGVGYGGFVGAKYYFAPAIGVFAEAGYESLSYFKVGLAFKF